MLESTIWLSELTLVLGRAGAARRLLREAGSLRRALSTPSEVLRARYGISARRAAAWDAMRNLVTAATWAEAAALECLADPESVRRAVVPLFALRRREALFVLPLDAQLQPLAPPLCVAEGSPDSISVEPRRLFESLLRVDATAAILTHNHPSGILEPSAADRAFTNRVRQLGEALGIRVVDHLIVGGPRAYSLAHELVLPVESVPPTCPVAPCAP